MVYSFAQNGHALESTSERRIHHRHHSTAKKSPPLQSLSELLSRSADLTKQFEKQTARLREKVQESEVVDAANDNGDVASSFIETNPLPEDAGLRAMESVNEEILRYTDKMRKLGNEASLFSHR
jgi:hypothetical protein